MIQFFLNSSDIDEIRYALNIWRFDGIGLSIGTSEALIEGIAELVAGQDMIVTVPTNPEHHNDHDFLIKDGRALADISPRFVISLPGTEEGFRACYHLQNEGINCQMTLCYSLMQAMQAMRVWSAYLAIPLISGLPAAAVALRDKHSYETRVIADIDSAEDITEAARQQVDGIAADFATWKAAFNNERTASALADLL